MRIGTLRKHIASSKPIAILFKRVVAAAIIGASVLWIRSALAAREFALSEDGFLLAGKPFSVQSAELHYARIPREYWRDRLQKAKAMGCNAVSTYVFWNLHEPRPGQFEFGGQADVAQFVRQAGEEGLLVIVRIGPYVCAEWDLGGLPAWLLADPGMHLRSNHPAFLEATERYFNRLGRELAPLQATRGGPIVMVQVENEYSSYEGIQSYLVHLRDQIRAAGFGVPLFTSTWPDRYHVRLGSLPDCLNTVTLGQNAASTFSQYEALNLPGPKFCSEFWVGWFDNWGGQHAKTDAAVKARELEWMLGHEVSVNFYLFQGGTTFGFFNGANGSGADRYWPTTSSYNYDAILDEAGHPTDKFYAFRDVIRRHLPAGTRLPDLPAAIPTIDIPRFELDESASVTNLLHNGVESAKTMNMEALGQSFGYLLYRTRLTGPARGPLVVEHLRDYAVVMLNGYPVGAMDRRHLRSQQIDLVLPKGEATLDILVENSGRINFGIAMNEERKGIRGRVLFDGAEVTGGWQNFSLPLDDLKGMKYTRKQVASPVLRRGEFRLEQAGDTFFDMRGWGKGQVWVNGRNLGRHWYIGPQQTVFCPGVWLKTGVNEIVVLEIENRAHRSIAGLRRPVYGGEADQLAPPERINHGATLSLFERDLLYQGEFANTNAVQTVSFPPAEARFVCLRASSGHGNNQHAAIAEFQLVAPDGRLLPRERWQVCYTDTEELKSEHGNADNIMDGKPDTFWHTGWTGITPRFPHAIVIDLGEVARFSGFQYLPRQEEKPGRIRHFKFYARKDQFAGLR